MSILKEQILGTWLLQGFEFTIDGNTESHQDARGISIFSDDGYYSVCLNQAENPEKPYHPCLIKNYYSAGKFSLSQNSYFEQNIVHAFGSRVGEKREVKIELQGNNLIKEMNFPDGSILKMTWVREHRN